MRRYLITYRDRDGEFFTTAIKASSFQEAIDLFMADTRPPGTVEIFMVARTSLKPLGLPQEQGENETDTLVKRLKAVLKDHEE